MGRLRDKGNRSGANGPGREDKEESRAGRGAEMGNKNWLASGPRSEDLGAVVGGGRCDSILTLSPVVVPSPTGDALLAPDRCRRQEPCRGTPPTADAPTGRLRTAIGIMVDGCHGGQIGMKNPRQIFPSHRWPHLTFGCECGLTKLRTPHLEQKWFPKSTLRFPSAVLNLMAFRITCPRVMPMRSSGRMVVRVLW